MWLPACMHTDYMTSRPNMETRSRHYQKRNACKHACIFHFSYSITIFGLGFLIWIISVGFDHIVYSDGVSRVSHVHIRWPPRDLALNHALMGPNGPVWGSEVSSPRFCSRPTVLRLTHSRVTLSQRKSARISVCRGSAA